MGFCCLNIAIFNKKISEKRWDGMGSLFSSSLSFNKNWKQRSIFKDVDEYRSKEALLESPKFGLLTILKQHDQKPLHEKVFFSIGFGDPSTSKSILRSRR